MNRTVATYTVAVATLAGTFWLALPNPPASTPPPPQPPPQPIIVEVPVPAPTPPPVPEPVVYPVTKLQIDDSAIDAFFSLDRGYLSTAGVGYDTEPVWMDITLRGKGNEERQALSTVLVIDRSGSMAGEKIDDAKRAAKEWINRLHTGDAVSVVSYGTDVMVDLPFTVVNDSNRSTMIAAIDKIEEGGGTNIDGGLQAALEEIAKWQPSGARRVVMISDGRPTEGQTDENILSRHSATFRQRSTTLTTIGVGLDYNEDLMEKLAVDGGGRYFYMKESSQMATILDDEFKHASAIVARNIRITLPMQMGDLAFDSAMGANAQMRDNVATIDVGDLSKDEERHVLIKLRYVRPTNTTAPATTTFKFTEFFAPEISYLKQEHPELLSNRTDRMRLVASTDSVVIEQSRDNDVRARVLQFEASMRLTESMQNFAKGDKQGAVRMLKKQEAALKDAAKSMGDNAVLRNEAGNMHKLINDLMNTSAESEAGLDMVKANKARASTLRR